MQPKRGEVTLPGSRLARGLKPTALTVPCQPLKPQASCEPTLAKKNCLALTPGSFLLMIPQLDDLESDLQTKLDLSRCGCGICDSSRGSWSSRTQEQPCFWIPKIGTVKDVEELGSKLEVSLF